MAVRCEFIDFIIPIENTDQVYPGGFEKYKICTQQLNHRNIEVITFHLLLSCSALLEFYPLNDYLFARACQILKQSPFCTYV